MIELLSGWKEGEVRGGLDEKIFLPLQFIKLLQYNLMIFLPLPPPSSFSSSGRKV